MHIRLFATRNDNQSSEYEAPQTPSEIKEDKPDTQKRPTSLSFLSDASTLVNVNRSAITLRATRKLKQLAEFDQTTNLSLSTAPSFSLNTGSTLLTSTPVKRLARPQSATDPDETEVEMLLRCKDANKENEPPVIRDRRRERRFQPSPLRYRPLAYRKLKEYG